MTVVRVRDEAALATAAAVEIAARAADAVASRGRFTLALTGGKTPRRLYALLATEEWRPRVPWERTHVFFGDERHVPPGHPDSNYGMAEAALLRHVSCAAVHRMEGELPADEAAARYEAVLRRHARGERPPRLDLVLLGLGEDAHVASLFPGEPALDERERWVAGPFVRKLGVHRITVTFPVLDAAAAVLFLVAGAHKADAVRRALSREDVPAARVRPASGEVRWLLDEAAAAGAPPSAG